MTKQEAMVLAALSAQIRAEQNEPLTLDELQEMDGEPVWLVSLGEDFNEGWYLIVAIDKQRLHCLQLYSMLFFEHYGKTWLAYRHKPNVSLALEELEEINAERNEPLTLDELRKMDGEPVWVCGPAGKCDVWMMAYSDCCENRTEVADYEDYGEWLAYRHKPNVSLVLEKLEEINAERNEPLTLDELREIDEEPVYLRLGDGREGYAIISWEYDIPVFYGLPYDDAVSGEYDIDFYALATTRYDPQSHWGLHHSLGWIAYKTKPIEHDQHSERSKK